MQLQEVGHNVSETALPPRFADSYYFSRFVKRHIGTSPWGWQKQLRLHRDAARPRGQEGGENLYLLDPHSPLTQP